VTRERLARVALLAYPRGVRAAKGEEMIGTLLDASGQSKARYGRELAARSATACERGAHPGLNRAPPA
jgi:hypothetical protein